MKGACSSLELIAVWHKWFGNDNPQNSAGRVIEKTPLNENILRKQQSHFNICTQLPKI